MPSPKNPALGDAYRNIVVTTGTGSGGVPGTTTAHAVDAQFNLDAGFGISLVADTLNNKVTIVNTGNGTGALTTITESNANSTYYPIFTRPPPGTQTFTVVGLDYVSSSVTLGQSEIHVVGSINDPTGVSNSLRAALVGLLNGETLQAVQVSNSATLNFTATGAATYSVIDGYWTIPISAANAVTDTLSSITIATGTGDLNPITGTYQMDTMYLDQTTTPLSYNPSTSTLTVSHLIVEGVTSTGATGSGKFVFDNTATLTGTTNFVDTAGGTNYTVLVKGVNGTGSTFGIGTGTNTYGIANDALDDALSSYVPYNITASTLSFNVPSHIGSISIDASGNTTINGHPTIEGVTSTGATGTGKIVFDAAPTFSSTVMIGSAANLTRFPSSLAVVSNTAVGIQQNESHIIGLLAEGTAHPSDANIYGIGVYGVGYTSATTRCGGVVGEAHVSASADVGSAIAVRGYSNDTHAGGLNVGLYGDATGGSSNYALYMNRGSIFANAAQVWQLYDNTAASLSFDTTGKTGLLVLKTTDGIEGVTMSGTLGVTGHVTVEGVTSTGATGSGKFVFDTSPTLVTPLLGTPQSGNFSTGTFTWPTFNQNTSGYAANLSGGNNTTLLGSVLYQSALNVTTQLAPNTTTTKKFLRQTGDGTNGAVPAWDTVTATDVGLGNVTNESKATMFTSPTFTGHPTIEGVTSTGATGTGKFVFDNAPTISGHPTIEGVTSTGATGTGKFVFDASPSLSGVTLTGTTTIQQTVEKFSSPSIVANAVTLDFTTGAIFALGSNAANITANFTNIPTTAGQTITTTLIISQGGTAYIPNALTINSVSQTIKWLSNATPSGYANKTDFVSFTFICTATSTYTVIGSLSTYG